MNRIERARDYDYVREAGDNRGQRVEGIQRWCGGQPGDSWCAEFTTMMLDIEYKGKAPIPRMANVQEIRELAEQNGWITTTPAVGDLFLYINAADHAHHIGFVTELEPLTGIAGNTSEDGASSNGDGVHEHEIHATTFIHLPE